MIQREGELTEGVALVEAELIIPCNGRHDSARADRLIGVAFGK